MRRCALQRERHEHQRHADDHVDHEVVRGGDHGRPAVARAGNVQDLVAGFADQPVELGVDEV